MLHKNKRRLYRKVRRILGDFTPLKADCGTLCGKRCCRGDSQTGMLLFPQEQTPLTVKAKGETRLAVCAGTCRRRARPLACRLFPLLPVPGKKRRPSVQTDLRAVAVCPLAAYAADVRLRARFVHRVRRAGALLLADADCRSFLLQAQREGRAAAQLRRQFTGEREK